MSKCYECDCGRPVFMMFNKNWHTISAAGKTRHSNYVECLNDPSDTNGQSGRESLEHSRQTAEYYHKLMEAADEI